MSRPSVSIIISAPQPFDGLPPNLAPLLATTSHTLCDVQLVGMFSAEISPPSPVTVIYDQRVVRGLNRAMRVAKGEILCFIDAYDMPSERWLDALTTPFSDPNIAGVRGVLASGRREIVARFIAAEYADRYRTIEKGQDVDLIEMFSAAYRRDILLANDGFDERFPDLNDRELSYRLHARGYRLAFAPEAIVYDSRKLSLFDYANRKAATAFWTAQIVRRFPSQGLNDRNTPQTLKAQMLLAGLATLGLALPPAWPLAVMMALLFSLSTLPFALRTARADIGAAVATPLMLYVRSIALMIGYGWGVVRPKPNITNAQTTIGGYQYLAKRCLDIVGGLVGCSLLLLLLPIVALCIKLDSRGPIFFRQERIGKGGKQFVCYKFRTMGQNAEAELDTLIDLEQLDEPAFKLKNDPRVTRFGRLLRRWSIDEVPQFWNVLRGDMSLVGPRPEETRIVARYSDWHRRRLAVKPGLSGPMQIRARGDMPLNERVQLEIEYIEQYSITKDLKILWQTLPAVYVGDGAY